MEYAIGLVLLEVSGYGSDYSSLSWVSGPNYFLSFDRTDNIFLLILFVSIKKLQYLSFGTSKLFFRISCPTSARFEATCTDLSFRGLQGFQ